MVGKSKATTQDIKGEVWFNELRQIWTTKVVWQRC
jgi:hypothetical protein